MKPKDKKMMDVQRVMRDPIIFKKKIEERPFDDLDNYVNYKIVYGEINNYRSRIVNQARAENTKEYIVAIIRYRTDLDETLKMEIKAKDYQIESIIPLNNEKLFLEVTGYRYKNDMGGDFNG